MNRFKLMMMAMNRPRLLLIAAFAVAVTVFVSDIGVTYAEQGPDDAKLATGKAERNRQVPAALKGHYAKKDADAAAHARAVRAEVVKQRKAQIDYTRKVLEGQGNTGGAK